MWYNLKGRRIVMESISSQKIGRQYKDTLFRSLFGESKSFLELYNAVADEHFPYDTEVRPCPSNDLLAKFNDLAACIGDQLVVFFEHQSTISKNMPLRLLSYVTDILNLHIVDKDKLYGNTQVMIPKPKFYILYNGEQKLGSRVMKLSEAFRTQDSEPALELTAQVIDINLNSGDVALNRSTTLQGYSFLIEEIRRNQLSGLNRDKAIIKAIDSCIAQDILTEFLNEHYLEVKKMLNWEYDADAERRVLTEEAIQQGLQQGQQQGAEMIVKMVKEGIPIDEALEKVITTPISSN